MKLYQVYIGNEELKNNYVKVPLGTRFCIKGKVYDIYAYQDENGLKELVTGIPLVHNSFYPDNLHSLSYYEIGDVDSFKVATFIEELRINESEVRYREMINNLCTEQYNAYIEKESKKMDLSNPDEIIRNFLRR